MLNKGTEVELLGTRLDTPFVPHLHDLPDEGPFYVISSRRQYVWISSDPNSMYGTTFYEHEVKPKQTSPPGAGDTEVAWCGS